MDQDRLSRKLAVILHADVVGSTSLVQIDEALAHQRMQSVFRKFSESIVSHSGIVHEIRGDALVAQFERASDAVSASLDFQKLNTESNSLIEDSVRPELRIGISLGEVIIADNTMTGEGIVLAQRLEQLASPGGVVVQGSVVDTVPSRLAYQFISLGEQQLKGFDKPVRAFAVSFDEDVDNSQGREAESKGLSDHSSNLYETLFGESFKLPDTPSIAVLPFQNMSADPEQEYFADGMTEDLITALSRFVKLLVIARNSTFAYKGRSVDVRDIGRELAVNHVLEGSIRKVGNRVRITAQLVETENGKHLWAENYDRELDDIFAVQDEITRKIVLELSVKLIAGEVDRQFFVSTNNIKAWELTNRAAGLVDTHVKDDFLRAKRLLQEALELDSNYAAAMIELGWIHFAEATNTWVSDSENSMDQAKAYAKKAIELQPEHNYGYALLGHVYMSCGDMEKAMEMSSKSVELGPGDAYALAFRGDILIEAGEFAEGINSLKQAIRLCPFPPAWFLFILGMGFHLNGENDLALASIQHSIEREPGAFIPLLWLTSVLVETGRKDEAISIAREACTMEPSFSVERWASKFSPLSHKRIKENLLTAGFPP